MDDCTMDVQFVLGSIDLAEDDLRMHLERLADLVPDWGELDATAQPWLQHPREQVVQKITGCLAAV